MNRQLIDYLPQILKDVRELKLISELEQTEISSLWDALENSLDDNFINDATKNGVLRFEKILNIVPRASDTLQDRKFRILARFNEQLPYTFRTLEERLKILCGENGYTCELFNDEYILKIRIELVVKNQYDAVEDLLERVVPANLIIDLDLRYNQYKTVSQFTHSQLANYTQGQLRNEVLN